MGWGAQQGAARTARPAGLPPACLTGHNLQSRSRKLHRTHYQKNVGAFLLGALQHFLGNDLKGESG